MKKIKILIVDDKKENRYLLETLLKGGGHQVVSAVNGKEALDLLRKEKFQMIVSDILMPVMDGFQLCHTVKNDDTLKDIPLVFYTATYVEKEDEEFALKLGATKFIRKPMDPVKFIQIVNHLARDIENGDINAMQEEIENEKEVFKLYNQRLIHKLEEKTLRLEKEVKKQKEVEAALVESEQRYRKIFDTIADALFISDLNGKIVEANPAACRMYGYTREELIGKHALELISPDYHPAFQKFLEELKETGRFIGETVDIRKDGISFFTEVHGTMIHIKGETHLLAIIRDLTERKQAEEMIIRTEKMATVGGLAAGMAHEINNPLAGILQALQVVRGRISPDIPANRKTAEACNTTMDTINRYLDRRKVPYFLEEAKEAGERAALIVENMLSFSRKSQSEFARHDVRQLLDKSVKLAENEYDLKRKFDFRNITVTREYAPDLPDVRCEATKIQQVFLNLLKNAAQALFEAKKTSPRITLRTKKEDNMLIVEIEDNGPGMPREIRKRIFEPFFTTKPAGDGTGLGLSVSYFIITRDHHGKMDVRSVPQKSTTFTIRIPLEKVKNGKGGEE